MNLKSNIGILIISLLSILTIVIWFFVRAGTSMFNDYHTAAYSLGQLAGLTGMTIFALTFVLTTRIKLIEDLFGGLDKMYKTHHFMGAFAFVLLLFHPLLLVTKFIPSNIKQAALYLLPGTSWAYNFGIMTLTLMALLIILTLYVNLKYPNWKLSHKFMGLVFFIAILHIFLITTDITFYPILRNYMIFLTGMGGVSYLYGSFIRPYMLKKLSYRVHSVINKKNITLIELSPVNKKLNFEPGQFVFIKFLDENIGKEQHPFTIASSPLNPNIKLAIKNLGDFTSKLGNLKPGTIAEVEGPYGNFNLTSDVNNQIWIAGGIGITPFLSMLDHSVLSDNNRKNISLYYCTKNLEEALFLEDIISIAKNNNSIKVIPWYSDEKGRISASEIEKRNSIKGAHFLICGPQLMMESLSQQLIKKGVPKSAIHMEDFGFK